MWRLLVRFFKINRFERDLFIWTAVSVCYYSILVAIVPRRYVLKRVGNLSVETAEFISEKDIVIVNQVSKAIRRSVRFIPWRVTCFAKAIAAKAILKREGISSTLYIGVGKSNEGKLTAHAWLRCGGLIVTGKEELVRFTPVAFFS